MGEWFAFALGLLVGVSVGVVLNYGVLAPLAAWLASVQRR